MFVYHTVLSTVPRIIAVNCWEIADLLVLLYVMFLLVSLSLSYRVSMVRPGVSVVFNSIGS